MQNVFVSGVLSLLLSLSPVFAQSARQAQQKVAYQAYTNYFESNRSGLKGQTSYLAFTNSREFDQVFGPAAVMGENRFLPEGVFRSKMVVAVIKRGKQLWTYTVRQVAANNNILYVSYDAAGRNEETRYNNLLFASPLIVAVEKGNYRSVAFIENGKRVGTTVASPQLQKSSHRSAVSNSSESQVKVFLVALADNGKIGRKIGCEDSLVPVKRTIKFTASPLKAALVELLSIPPHYPQNPKLQNFWKGRNLQLKSVSLRNGLATITFSGEISVAGICDEPRIIEQIGATARQFPSVKKVKVWIGGRSLADAIR